MTNEERAHDLAVALVAVIAAKEGIETDEEQKYVIMYDRAYREHLAYFQSHSM
jgi:hypothetical protein